MPKVSVIVPVYKVEEYLPACLASIRRQTYEDFELILVDDGSPDNCGALCDAYAAENPNTRVIHQENAGLSAARNAGVRDSCGEYVTFVDSDDYIAPDYIEYLVELTEKHGVDISGAKYMKVWSDGMQRPEGPAEDRKYPAGEALSKICYRKIPIFAVAKLYRRTLAEANPYPVGQLYEDTATTYKLVGATEAIAYGTKVIYYWRQRSGSITHEKIDERHFYGITASKEQLEYMWQHYPEAVPAAQASLVTTTLRLTPRLAATKNKAWIERLRAEIKPFWRQYLKDKNVAWSMKLMAFGLGCGYLPYRLLVALYAKYEKMKGRHGQ